MRLQQSTLTRMMKRCLAPFQCKHNVTRESMRETNTKKRQAHRLLQPNMIQPPKQWSRLSLSGELTCSCSSNFAWIVWTIAAKKTCSALLTYVKDMAMKSAQRAEYLGVVILQHAEGLRHHDTVQVLDRNSCNSPMTLTCVVSHIGLYQRYSYHLTLPVLMASLPGCLKR